MLAKRTKGCCNYSHCLRYILLRHQKWSSSLRLCRVASEVATFCGKITTFLRNKQKKWRFFFGNSEIRNLGTSELCSTCSVNSPTGFCSPGNGETERGEKTIDGTDGEETWSKVRSQVDTNNLSFIIYNL